MQKISKTFETKSMFSSIERPRPRLFILAGMPGCGKSTWARTYFAPQSIVSSDAIRLTKWPGEPYRQERNEEVFDAFHSRLGGLLDQGNDAVADATSLIQAARRMLSDLADYYNADKHLVFFNNPNQALRRNDAREGEQRVPWNVQKSMLERQREARSAILDELYTSTTIIEATT